MAQDQFEETRQRLLRTLLKQVATDAYPSTTTMDTIEELLTPDDVSDYADVLLGHIEDATYPSTPMIARLRNLAV